MPQNKKALCDVLYTYVNRHRTEFSSDKEILFCKICDVPVACKRKSQVDQHRNTKKHRDGLLNRSSTTQQLVRVAFEAPYENSFYFELCEAFLAGI